MAATTETKKKAETMEDKTAAKIEEYLQGPRKKRKNFVIFALGERFDKELTAAMEGYVRKSHAQLAISNPKTPDELKRQFGRNISLLVISDEFTDKTLLLSLIKSLKEKRRNELIPVLFLTREAEELVSLYHKELLLYHEADEYIVYPGAQRQQIMSRIKSGIETQNRRRSRRYSVNIPIGFYHLTLNDSVEGHLIDVSMHGAVLTADSEVIFRLGDQMKLNIPIASYIQYPQGDFIKISARVRRVFISGNKAAISFEHVTDKQAHLIGQLLLAVVGKQFARQTQKLRSQHGQSASTGNLKGR